MRTVSANHLPTTTVALGSPNPLLNPLEERFPFEGTDLFYFPDPPSSGLFPHDSLYGLPENYKTEAAAPAATASSDNMFDLATPLEVTANKTELAAFSAVSTSKQKECSWTKAEDEILRAAVNTTHKNEDSISWKSVVNTLKNLCHRDKPRTKLACRHRARALKLTTFKPQSNQYTLCKKPAKQPSKKKTVTVLKPPFTSSELPQAIETSKKVEDAEKPKRQKWEDVEISVLTTAVNRTHTEKVAISWVEVAKSIQLAYARSNPRSPLSCRSYANTLGLTTFMPAKNQHTAKGKDHSKTVYTKWSSSDLKLLITEYLASKNIAEAAKSIKTHSASACKARIERLRSAGIPLAEVLADLN
ncbi:MAG: hypothetical protein S4CHLAM37_01320 [Chlamydiia bacterium]|nr:hypothetical protein [Chlamydiia bacterium]